MDLGKIFDYQKFEDNKNMADVIEDVEQKYYGSSMTELSLDEMSYVTAAGAFTQLNEDEDSQTDKK